MDANFFQKEKLVSAIFLANYFQNEKKKNFFALLKNHFSCFYTALSQKQMGKMNTKFEIGKIL